MFIAHDEINKFVIYAIYAKDNSLYNLNDETNKKSQLIYAKHNFL